MQEVFVEKVGHQHAYGKPYGERLVGVEPSAYVTQQFFLVFLSLECLRFHGVACCPVVNVRKETVEFCHCMVVVFQFRERHDSGVRRR